MVKFLRRTWNRYAKLGKGRKKKQVWRSPKGRDNKMREKRRGYPAVVSVGYKQGENARGLLKEKKPVMVMNIRDLAKIGKDEIAVIGNVGNKKKMEIAKKAKEMKIQVYNLNSKTFLKKAEIKMKKKQEAKKTKIESKKKKEKKTEKKKSKEETKQEEKK